MGGMSTAQAAYEARSRLPHERAKRDAGGWRRARSQAGAGVADRLLSVPCAATLCRIIRRPAIRCAAGWSGLSETAMTGHLAAVPPRGHFVFLPPGGASLF